MLKLSILLSAVAAVIGSSQASATPAAPAAEAGSARQSLLVLSRQKWLWMAERDMAKLEPLFHLGARFVHMGATMDRAGELDVIRTGRIQYKHAEIGDMSVEVIGDTAIVISRLRLVAVVGGNEVTNPFSVTETYVRQHRRWELAAMAFTRLLGE